MSDSDSSSGLSEAPEEEVQKLAPIFLTAKKATKKACPPPPVSPPRPKRPASPPHEEVFADNPDIAFLVMFRSRFTDAFPSKLSNFGPQDIERGVTDQPPSPEVQSLLCALLALVLNRKKPVERGHHGRALEEAVLSQKAQWPHSWRGINPLHGPKDFNTMSPTERLNLLRTLVIWSLTSSEAISSILKDKYKQQRHNDDENQPLSVQPWGVDGDKRRYFLVQGLEDTHFRVYREGSRHTKNATWISVAGNIQELQALTKKLEEVDGTQAARRLAMKMTNAIPAFQASQEKRERREYRQIKRAAFTRPEPGFSLYEGRTRGKRMRYTYDDDDAELDSDATSGGARRSSRNSARDTPASDGPTYTASGRQIRQPRQGEYGESLLRNSIGVDGGTDELAPEFEGGDDGGDDESEPPTTLGRATRGAGRSAAATNGASNPKKRKHIDGYNDIDAMSEEEDDAGASGDDWDSDKNDADEEMPEADDADEEPSEDEEEDEEDDEPRSRIVKLKVSPDAMLKSHHHASVKAETNGEHGYGADVLERKPGAYSGDDAHASAGAAEREPTPSALPNGLSNGYAKAQPAPNQPSVGSSPPGASAYPTPASASFPAQEANHAVAPAPSTQQSFEQRQEQAPGMGMHQVPHRVNGVSGMNGY